MPKRKKLLPEKFHIGQLLQFNPSSNTYAAVPGATCKIVGLDTMPSYIRIRWINNALKKDQNNGEYYPQDFNIKFKPLKTLLKKALRRKRITNLEYLELLSKNNLK